VNYKRLKGDVWVENLVGNGKKKRVLIYDDNPGVCKLIEAYAETLNFDVIIANTQEELEEQYPKHSPDVVLFDLNIPNSDFKDSMKFLSQQSYRCPIVIFSGVDEALRKIASKVAEELGLTLLPPLKKPISYTDVINTLNYIKDH